MQARARWFRRTSNLQHTAGCSQHPARRNASSWQLGHPLRLGWLATIYPVGSGYLATGSTCVVTTQETKNAAKIVAGGHMY